ncbi:MAG TPA: alpha/beta hydrolase [Bacteroidales bacterium]|nr:alpha/beta hydrolase [Bacteroidales bacterium]
MKTSSILFFYLVFILLGCKSYVASQKEAHKPTICILGGTPSTKDILQLIPDSMKKNYHFISFNRPGFGGSPNAQLTREKLYKLAKEAGLRKNDFGIIGVSGGAPLAILLASEFKLKHCGVISGMVSAEAFFQYEKKAITSGIMRTALTDYKNFESTALQFPNLDEIVKQAGAPSKEVALRACYDEFNFILADHLFSGTNAHSLRIDWWHGTDDVNVPIEAVELFLKDFPNASLYKIPNANHGIDANLYISKALKDWK